MYETDLACIYTRVIVCLNPFRIPTNTLFINPAFHAGLFTFDPFQGHPHHILCSLCKSLAPICSWCNINAVPLQCPFSFEACSNPFRKTFEPICVHQLNLCHQRSNYLFSCVSMVFKKTRHALSLQLHHD